MIQITSSLYDTKTKVTVSEDDRVAITMDCGSRIIGRIYEIITFDGTVDGALVLSTDSNYDDITIDIDQIEKIEKV